MKKHVAYHHDRKRAPESISPDVALLAYFDVDSTRGEKFDRPAAEGRTVGELEMKEAKESLVENLKAYFP